MPSYSTDKGFTGDTKGGTKDKDKNKSGNLGGGGALGMGAARDRANARLSGHAGGLSEEGQKSITDKSGEGRGPGFVPEGMVQPFSRTKVKKGVSRTPTPGNVLKGALTALGMGPLAAIGTIAGSEEVDALPDLGMGYEGPVGESEYTESDPSQLAENKSQSEFAPPQKKKKNNPLGNIVGTLLADSGGTLVAG